MSIDNINTQEVRTVDEEKQNEINETIKRKEEIESEDGKKIGSFILILILSGLAGGFLGAFGVMLFKYINEYDVRFLDLFAQIQRDFTVPASFIMIGADFLLMLFAFFAYLKAKKLWNSDMDDDEKYEKTDRKLSVGLILTNVLYFVNFSFFGFAFYTSLGISKEENQGWFGIYLRMVVLIIFTITLFVGLAIQKACVNQTKLMNPEKKGSIYDTKFNKVWYASCDEAERMQIGIASYQAFKVTNNVLLWLMVTFVMGGMFLEIGILPILVIAIIAIVMNVTYGVASMNAGNSQVYINK